MKRSFLLLAVLVFVVAIRPDTAPAQVRWQVGMRLGLSIFTGYNLGGGAANNILNYLGAPAASTSRLPDTALCRRWIQFDLCHRRSVLRHPLRRGRAFPDRKEPVHTCRPPVRSRVPPRKDGVCDRGDDRYPV